MTAPSQQSKPQTLGCTCMRLRKAARRVTQIYDHCLAEAGITVTQYGMLGYLWKFEGISIGALADKLVMDPTTLTRNLRPLQQRGLIASKPDRTDKRTRCLRLTAAGRDTFEKAKPAWVRAQRHVEKALGELEAPALNAALDRVLEKLSAS